MSDSFEWVPEPSDDPLDNFRIMGADTGPYSEAPEQEPAAPFTLARLIHVIEKNGYHCGYSDGEDVVGGSWNDVGFRFIISEAQVWLRVSSTWIPPEEITNIDSSRIMMILQETANEWNRLYLQPTAYPNMSDDGWQIVFDQSIYVEKGLTDQQIECSLDRTLDVTLQAHEKIAQLLPPVL